MIFHCDHVQPERDQIRVHLGDGRFAVQLDIRDDTTGRIGQMPAHHIVDLGAHYRHKSSGLTFRLIVKNALDDVYITARRPEGIFTSGYRQITLGVRWDYEKKPTP